MAQTISKIVTFEEFLKRKPENKLQELYEGTIVEMQPTGKHEEITGFLTTELAVEYKRLKLPYFIQEYWIVDDRALGGRRYTGNPKQPTISIYQLVEEEYRVTLFQQSDRLSSAIFPNLNLTASQIFQAG